jgi:hypothetical protein
MPSKKRKKVSLLPRVPHSALNDKASKAQTSFSSSALSRAELISSFHALQKRRDQLSLQFSQDLISSSSYQSQLALVNEESKALGGLEGYQQLSIAGHHNKRKNKFHTGIWIMERLLVKKEFSSLWKNEKKLKKKKIQTIKKQRKNEQEKEEKKEQENNKNNITIKEQENYHHFSSPVCSPAESIFSSFSSSNLPAFLDVGAIDNQFYPYSHLFSLYPIDLNPQHSTVIPMDFFHLNPFNKQFPTLTAVAGNNSPVESKSSSILIPPSSSRPFSSYSRFHIISLSLVLNYVGDLYKRGQMLVFASELLHKGGFLYLIIPLACVENSKYLTNAILIESIIKPLGFQCIQWKYSTKLAFYEFQKTEFACYPSEKVKFLYHHHGQTVRPQDTCNNFQIIAVNPRWEMKFGQKFDADEPTTIAEKLTNVVGNKRKKVGKSTEEGSNEESD